MTLRSVAVIGGGISGLVAAYRLRCALGPAATITIIDAARRFGGSLRTVPFADGGVDVGAEAFVGRRPEVVDLLTELGLSDQLVHPAGLRPLVWANGSPHPLPAPTLMGVPSGPDAVAGVVDAATRERIEREPATPLHWDAGADISVGALVANRFGEQVVARSVDPLLGGVYAGTAATIGVRAALPTLAAALDAGAPSLSAAVASAMPKPAPGPVFGGIRDGYGALLDALRERTDAVLHTGTAVTGVRREPAGWVVDPLGVVDAVVLAVPAPRAAALLADVAPAAASAAAEIDLASSALVVLAFPAGTELPSNSGILVATGERLAAKAFTLSSRKWPHLAQRDAVLVRASFGRFGDSGIVDRPDTELIASARADLETVCGVAAEPVQTHVQRWRGGLPQYAPGHLDRVAAIRAGVAGLDGLAVAGAYLDGVGVPACVASGTAAAARLIGPAAARLVGPAAAWPTAVEG
ncbi:protoporphyrinogen oxidase [Aldersonia sp. NBC_00410]|uniref:protoporphyrinogen oxidase n=1 Tax=Aldersonia sp. NBC_00410 TaxID=2975954 RepID=UPI00224D708A|nr:protoporphyrinogen oxidase [Aldersonia sp. NBC_00410]MCX5042545.1 protoporphyrinogen oxidase [Aldersonia sp. NBC_00410]